MRCAAQLSGLKRSRFDEGEGVRAAAGSAELVRSLCTKLSFEEDASPLALKAARQVRRAARVGGGALNSPIIRVSARGGGPASETSLRLLRARAPRGGRRPAAGCGRMLTSKCGAGRGARPQRVRARAVRGAKGGRKAKHASRSPKSERALCCPPLRATRAPRRAHRLVAWGSLARQNDVGHTELWQNSVGAEGACGAAAGGLLLHYNTPGALAARGLLRAPRRRLMLGSGSRARVCPFPRERDRRRPRAACARAG